MSLRTVEQRKKVLHTTYKQKRQTSSPVGNVPPGETPTERNGEMTDSSGRFFISENRNDDPRESDSAVGMSENRSEIPSKTGKSGKVLHTVARTGMDAVNNNVEGGEELKDAEQILMAVGAVGRKAYRFQKKKPWCDRNPGWLEMVWEYRQIGQLTPALEKIGEELSHRDYLGSLMNLGIRRDTIGDILVKGKTGFIFSLDDVAELILKNLVKIRHTQVSCTIIDDDIKLKPTLIDESYPVSSMRLDVILAAACKFSRRESLGFFERNINVKRYQ